MTSTEITPQLLASMPSSATNHPDSMFNQPDTEIITAQETVTFLEDGDIIKGEEASSNEMEEMMKLTEDTLLNDVKSFLQRPVEISNNTWTTAMTTSTVIHTIELPRNYFDIPMYYEKLSGFRYLKADFRIKLQVNAQPFNAGVLLMWWEPFSAQQTVVPTNVQHLGGITGYRHVKLDLSTTTTAELLIPWINPINALTMDRTNVLGKVRMIVYSPLTGTGDAETTLWIHAENITLNMPMSLPPRPLGILAAPSGPAQMAGESNYTPGTRPVSQIRTPKAPVTSGKTPPPAKRPVSNWARGVMGMTELFHNVPVVGGLFKGASWVAKAIAGLASEFGMSRPRDTSTTVTVQPVYAPALAQYNADSKAKSLAFDLENEVVVTGTHFGTIHDEMSIRHILNKWIYLDRFTMNAVDNATTVIWKWEVSPTQCLQFTSPTTPFSTFYYNTYLSYLAAMFQYWRGGIRYHFRMVKTPFHSGRVRVTFFPGIRVQDNIGDHNKCYSQVIDIRDRTSFTIEVPFVANVPWLRTDQRSRELTQHQGMTGTIFVEVVNALKNPAAAASSIEFIVETSAMEDFQFAVPIMDERVRNTYGTMVIPPLLSSSPSGPAQIADDDTEEVIPLFATHSLGGIGINAITTGEVIVNLRTLLKRYELVSQGVDPVWPAGELVYNPLGVVQTLNPIVKDSYSWIALLYRFYTGSSRLLFEPTTVPTGGTMITASIEEVFPFQLSRTVAAPGNSTARARQIYYSGLERLPEVEVPYYSQTPISITPVGALTRAPIMTGTANMPYQDRWGVRVNMTESYRLWRSVGEDFSFGYLIGPPVTYTRP